MEKIYTAMIVQEGKWYAGTIKELSGCHSQGESKEEVLDNLKEAIQLITDSNERHAADYAPNFQEVLLSIEA